MAVIGYHLLISHLEYLLPAVHFFLVFGLSVGQLFEKSVHSYGLTLLVSLIGKFITCWFISFMHADC